MARSTVLRALRLPLVLIAVLALLWVGLMSVERTSSRPAGLRVVNVSSQSNANSDAKGGDRGTADDNSPKHCTDGHGHDDVHNKHCRPISKD